MVDIQETLTESLLLLWIGSGVPHRDSCVNDLVPSAAMFTGRSYGRQVVHKGSFLISGLIH